MDPSDALPAIERFGLPIVGLVVLAVVCWWLLRLHLATLHATIADTRKERDEALAGWRAQTGTAEKVIDRLDKVEQRLVDELSARRRS